MSLSDSSWSSTLLGLLTGFGMVGPDTPKFASVIAKGSIQTLSGKTFATIDSGTVAGTGSGVGNGLIIPPSIAAPIIIAKSIASFGGSGFALPLLALAVDLAMVLEALKISLSSTHAPVHIGTGVVVVGSMPITGAEWGANITASGLSDGFVGPSWPGFANALGEGMAASYKLAVGTVAITGPGSSTGGGVGVGQGTIS